MPSVAGMGAQRHQDLQCWRLANALQTEVYALTARAPAADNQPFCEQIQATARLATHHIANGFACDQIEAFARYLEMARGAIIETTTHVLDARTLGYIDNDELRRLTELSESATTATTAFLRWLRSPDGSS
jgi:four helix bundle protein